MGDVGIPGGAKRRYILFLPFFFLDPGSKEQVYIYIGSFGGPVAKGFGMKSPPGERMQSEQFQGEAGETTDGRTLMGHVKH